MISIRKRLKNDFLQISIISAVIILIISNIGITAYFREYVNNLNKTSDLKIIGYISEYFNNSEINAETIHSIVYLSRNENVEVLILDKKDNMILDTREYRGSQTTSGAGAKRKQWEDSLVFKNYDLLIDEIFVGKVSIGRPAVFSVAENDRMFIIIMNIIFIFAFILMLVFSFYKGKTLSDKFLYPLLNVKRNVESIKNEKYEEIEAISTDMIEMNELSETIIELGRKLDNIEKLRRRLSADIAHELRTPLSNLQTYFEAFIDGAFEPSKDRILSCNDEILRLSKLVNDLRELSNAESKEIKLEISEFNISELVNNTVSLFLPIFDEKGQKLITSIQNNISFKGDKHRINQVIINLLSNANKYTPDEGEIIVELKQENDETRIKVIDNGLGIAEQDLPFIFERFYRGEKSRNKETGGTGIGLSISKAFVELHGGEINVYSVKDEGTTIETIFNNNFFK